MLNIVIKNLDNDAFSESKEKEVARILRQLATDLENKSFKGVSSTLLDANGNTVGFIESVK